MTPRVGVPRTETRPSSTSRSSGAASSRWAAISSTWSRTSSDAARAAPPATTAVRLPPVPGTEGCARGVALHHDHVVQRHAEVLGDDLRHRRLDALAVRARPEQHRHRAARLDAHRRALHADRACRHARRLHVEPDPDPEQPAFVLERASLLGPEGVVADDLRRLLERLGRRDMVELHPHRGRERQLVGADHVATAELERIHADGPARRGPSSPRARPTRTSTGPRYAPRPQVFVHTAVLVKPIFGSRYGPGNSIAANAPAPPVPPVGYAPQSSR